MNVIEPKKKKAPIAFLILGAVASAYLGYLLNAAWYPGIDFNHFMEAFSRISGRPFENYLNDTTIKAITASVGIYVMVVIMYYTSQRNLMPGKEYGTARFADVRMVNQALMDKNENYNRIISQNVRMSLNFRKIGLNGNILVIGGSGAGKTFYVVKPQLMNMPEKCSFICTDPKGEIL